MLASTAPLHRHCRIMILYHLFFFIFWDLDHGPPTLNRNLRPLSDDLLAGAWEEHRGFISARLCRRFITSNPQTTIFERVILLLPHLLRRQLAGGLAASNSGHLNFPAPEDRLLCPRRTASSCHDRSIGGLGRAVLQRTKPLLYHPLLVISVIPVQIFGTMLCSTGDPFY
ncbi:hypothetical protein, variant 1 [Blastomyces gilchristii SLH14081]|uniref:Secreted protein n=1 Tax=Blastomyces gilchristii (strain SLH14081) TaxID=559298 RepID=A0A179V023_BLAGS|nr:uncharacterized protein BDBG_07982 [Blastomyces gilchristii SLH14081]XP_031580486.1 hypothetical protein, variant 1 [Blastomyces gilchristii SLH14081]OAT12660.1 hypothetical protein BDBG_07982 [Blastomyces gilchristii SLH14081]OAT12661.1 hypothetical protein, variant 1 [Blastomyces gilchristii SLH14081]